MEAHPDADRRQPEAAVVVVLAEQVAHHERADQKQPGGDGHGDAGDAADQKPDDRLEVGVALARLELGEVGQKRGLDRHEELQGRARDQEHVEDDPGDDLVVRCDLDRDDGGVQERLLGEHDAGDGDREAGRLAARVLDPLGLLLGV